MNAKALSTAVLAAATLVTFAVVPAAPAQAVKWPPPDPDSAAALWQVTEIVANSANHGGDDAFEYVEIVNASDGPLVWDDFRLRYLRPLIDRTTVWTQEWPTTTTNVTVDAGESLVLWVRNGASSGLGVADFNAAYGTSLVEGRDLAMVDGTGLTNGDLRGVEISTPFGVQLTRALYNEPGNADASVASGVGVTYAPATEAGGVQERVGTADPTPGTVDPAQLGDPLAQPVNVEPPVIIDDTSSTFAPGRGVEIQAWIRDDAMVRSATVEVWSDVDSEPVEYSLTRDQPGTRAVYLSAADTVGRSELTYRMSAWDGENLTVTEERTLSSGGVEPGLRIGGGHEGQPLGADLVVDPSPLRLARAEGDTVAGTVALVAGGDVYPPVHTLSLDGTEVAGVAELEHEPVLAFEVTLTDPYFRNGVRIGDDVLTVFDEGTFGATATVETSVPLDEVNPGEPVVVRIYAGTKAAPVIDEEEANDDFLARNVRLALPDGRMVTPRDYDGTWIAVGDGGRAQDYYEAVFDVPEDAFTALRYDWDSTAALDGDHEFAASDGVNDTQIRLASDNSAPVIEPTVADGDTVRGTMALNADVADVGSGVASVRATLNGRAVRLPYEVSSLNETPGTHRLTVAATDAAGNAATRTVRFTIPHEQPVVDAAAEASGAVAATMTAVVDDAHGDLLTIDFARGVALELGSGVQVATGTTEWSDDPDRASASLVSDDALLAMATPDSVTADISSDTALPYVLVTADTSGATGDHVRLRWTGTAEAQSRLTLSLKDPSTGEWVPWDDHITAESGEDVTLEALVPIADYADHDTIAGLVQHTQGWAGADRSTRASASSADEPHHPEDLPRSDYDFTLAWESDTQYYNAREEIYDRQTSIHDYLLRVRDDINLQYLIHTGDIVDWSTNEEQWQRADAAYSPLDQAGLPYGVLAGNHDVDQTTNDYGPYSQWFGDARFADNPWFGGSHLDNRGHYDLITAGGIDFIFLYMGWGATDEQITWMNDTLDAYPERVAVVSLHEYMLTTGGLGPLPQRIYDEVIATQPTVKFVLSGHYHDAYTRTDTFDDDGDGQDDRTVTSMLFDYQDLPNGGEGYVRLLHFDHESSTIRVRTYSDYLKDYTAVHTALDDANQDFTIPYAQAGITVEAKTLSTDAVQVDVLSDQVLASFDQVRALTPVEAPADGTSWYVRATDPYGATAYSDIIDTSGGTLLATGLQP